MGASPLRRLAKWIDLARESSYAQLSATLLLLVVGFPLASSALQLCTLQVTALDNEGNPIPQAKRSVQREGHELFSASSDTEGLARIPGSPSGSYKIVAEEKAFFPASLPIDLTTLESAAELTLSTKRDESERLTVRADAPTEPATGRVGITVGISSQWRISGITCAGSGVILMCFSDRRP